MNTTTTTTNSNSFIFSLINQITLTYSTFNKLLDELEQSKNTLFIKNFNDFIYINKTIEYIYKDIYITCRTRPTVVSDTIVILIVNIRYRYSNYQNLCEIEPFLYRICKLCDFYSNNTTTSTTSDHDKINYRNTGSKEVNEDPIRLFINTLKSIKNTYKDIYDVEYYEYPERFSFKTHINTIFTLFDNKNLSNISFTIENNIRFPIVVNNNDYGHDDDEPDDEPDENQQDDVNKNTDTIDTTNDPPYHDDELYFNYTIFEFSNINNIYATLYENNLDEDYKRLLPILG